MRKIHKILDIKEPDIDYIKNAPVAIEICNVHHSPVHIHSSAVELIYCLEGTVDIRCNHEIVTLNKGQIFTVDFEDIHCLFSDCENLLIIMHIDLKRIGRTWEFLQYVYFACEDNSCQPYQKEPLQNIKNLILAAAFLYTKNGYLSPDESISVSQKIADILLEYFDWFNYINVYPSSNDEIHERFQAITAYCCENSSRKVTISELAKTVHINENYLSQFIHKSPYGNFSNMMGYIRCFNAQKLLLTTNHSVSEISELCGFSDSKYFYKHFRLAWGYTPSEYRHWFKNYIREPDEIYSISAPEAYKKLESYAAEYFSYHILSV